MNGIPGSPVSLPLNMGPSSVESASSIDQEALARRSDEFEGLFLSMLLKEMRNTLSEGGMFGGESSDVYGGLFDMMMSQSLAESRPLGLARLLEQSLANFPDESSLKDTAAIPEVDFTA